MMHHRLQQWVLTLLVCFLACSPTPPDGDGRVAIEFWTVGLGDSFADYILGMIAAYEADHPEVRVTWVDVSGSEAGEKLLAALIGGTPPDLVNIGDLSSFLEHGLLASMDNLVPLAERYKRLEIAWKGVGYYQGTNYALPWYMNVSVMWYNRELFAAAGLDPNRPPTTIDEMLEAGRIIRRRTGKYGVSWRLHTAHNAPPSTLLRLDGFWPLFDPDFRRTTINSPRARAILQKWVDAYRDGVLPPEALASGHREDVNWFIEGRAAMLPFTGGWITRYFDTTIETKAAVTFQPRGALGRVPAGISALVVPKASRNQRQAVDFGLFVTNDENQLEFCRLVPILPSTKKAAADSFFLREPVTVADEALRIAALDISNSYIDSNPDVKGWSRMQDILHEEFSKAMAGERSLEEALAHVERKWNRLLQYR